MTLEPSAITEFATDLIGTRARVVRCDAIAGGDIHRAYRLLLEDGRRLFVKSSEHAPEDLFAREAEGLRYLAAAEAIRVPAIVGISAKALVLEWIEGAAPGPHFDEAFGRGLAKLHRTSAPRFGFEHDNYIGSLPQTNVYADDWATFYRDQRLLPMFRRSESLFDADARRAFDRLLARLDELVGPSEPPARLHGDLWSGNVMSDERGDPVLVDPAVYGGHREVDLAMLRLFGSVSARMLAAYEEVCPLADGHEARVALYQLYPLLVHVGLFGAGYVASVKRVLHAYA